MRSAARATSSAYRRLPIRWRLAGRSAALTLVILCGFAMIVRRAHHAPDPRGLPARGGDQRGPHRAPGAAPAHGRQRRQSDRAVRAGVDRPRRRGRLLRRRDPGRHLGRPRRLHHAQHARLRAAAGAHHRARWLARGDPGGPGHRLAGPVGPPVRQSRSPRSRTQPIASRSSSPSACSAEPCWPAWPASLWRAARWSRSPSSAAARRIEQSRDPSEKMPHAEAEDEVAELGRTLEAMLASLDQARSETESALARQREFVADASHELRTPLTSVLANLELLEVELAGEQRETAAHCAPHAACAVWSPTCCCWRAPTRYQARPTRRSTCPRSSPTRPRQARGGRPRDLGLGPGGRPRRRRPGRAAQARAESDGERAPAHRSRDRRRGHGGAPQRRVCSPSRTTAPGSRPKCARRSSSASTADPASRAARRGSAFRSSARSPSRTAAASVWRSRWTAAERVSWSGFRPRALKMAPGCRISPVRRRPRCR